MLYKIKNHLLLLFILLAIFMGVTLSQTVSTSIVRGAYSISLMIKDSIMIFLPFVIFSCISHSLIQEQNTSIKILILIIVIICLSNFISTMVAFVLGKTIVAIHSVPPKYAFAKVILEPFNIPKIKGIVSNEKGLFAGITLGFIANKFDIKTLKSFINSSYKLSMLFLKKIFIPVVPLFILGFVAKFSYEGMLEQLIKHNLYNIILILCSIFGYLLFIFYIASSVTNHTKQYIIKNISIPVLSAFSAMSSTAALPLSISAAEKNIRNKNFASMYIPTSVNIHLIGDSIILPMLAIILMYHFNGHTPPLDQYLLFSAYFIISKFAIATVPGGGIFIMLPVLEQVFKFSPEMGAIITTFYLLLDPILAATNVTGNNLFCIILDKILFTKPQVKLITN